MKFTYGILILATCLLFGSCKKYLDTKSSASLVVPQTLADLQALLDYSDVMNIKSPSWDQASDDDYFLPLTTYNSIATKSQNAYVWQNAPYSTYTNDWSYIYDAVLYANTALDNVTNISKTDQNAVAWNNVKGSALFYRAELFLKAAFVFAKAYDSSTYATDPGIVLRLTSDITVPSTRSNVRDSYDKIISDIKEAAQLLPVTPITLMRPSRTSAYGMLARAYLSMRSYDSAYKYAGLALTPNSVLIDYNTLSASGTSTPFTQFNGEVLFHYSINSFIYAAASTSNARVDTALYASYSANDLRKTLFFNLKTDGYSFRGNYSGGTNFYFTGIAKDEMYLIKSECAARLGNTIEAMTVLNSLLATRWKTGTFVPFAASTPSAALSVILTERRKELLFRGLRWMDIKRLNKEGANIMLMRKLNGVTYTLPPNDNRYALLLPADIVNITGMPQNPQ